MGNGSWVAVPHQCSPSPLVLSRLLDVTPCFLAVPPLCFGFLDPYVPVPIRRPIFIAAFSWDLKIARTIHGAIEHVVNQGKAIKALHRGGGGVLLFKMMVPFFRSI